MAAQGVTAHTFTFEAMLAKSKRFEYAFDDAAPKLLKVDVNGTATVRWTVPSQYGHSLAVRSRTANGVISCWTHLNLWAE